VEKFKEKKRERYLSSEELARLGHTLAVIESEGSELPSVLTALRLLILTGARLSEVLELKWEYVDLERGALALPDSKTGAKLIPLGRAALEVLEGAVPQAGNPYVCPGANPASHLVGLPKAWRRIRDRAGLKNIRLHDLRHSFASVAAASGQGLPVIGALLGHKEAATTARYAHLANDPLKQAADMVSGKIAEAMKKPISGKIIPLHRNQV
jgi:integrase